MDQKVVIYGLQSDGGSPPVITTRAFQFDVYNTLPVNVYLAGTIIFSGNVYSPYSFESLALTDFFPCQSFPFIVGQNPQNSDFFWQPPTFVSSLTIGVPQNHMQVSELFNVNTLDTPAAATAVDFTVSAGADSAVMLEDLNVSLVAVAAQAAPVTLTITEDNGGAATVIFRKSYIAPAGTCVNDNIRLHMLASVDARVQISAPAATNFVSANLRWNGSLVDPGLLGEGPTP